MQAATHSKAGGCERYEERCTACPAAVPSVHSRTNIFHHTGNAASPTTHCQVDFSLKSMRRSLHDPEISSDLDQIPVGTHPPQTMLKLWHKETCRTHCRGAAERQLLDAATCIIGAKLQDENPPTLANLVLHSRHILHGVKVDRSSPYKLSIRRNVKAGTRPTNKSAMGR